MTTRFALLELIERNKLDARTASGVWQLAAFDRPPPALLSWIRLGMASLGAGCAGLGVIFWIAANWGLLSRFQQFALLQSLVLVLCIGTAAFPKARAPLGLLTLLASGGLFAAIGQTYQTGADPWQLFALWAGLTLPLVWAVRADSLWAAWGVVALTAIVLWAGPRGWFSWRAAEMAGEHSIAVLLAALLAAALGKHGRRWTGAGAWAFGITLVLASVFATTLALADLFGESTMCYWFSLVLFAGFAAALAQQQPFDVLAASVAGLAINVLLVAGLARVLFWNNASSGLIFPLLVLGLVAAGLLALSAKLIMDGARQSGVRGETA